MKKNGLGLDDFRSRGRVYRRDDWRRGRFGYDANADSPVRRFSRDRCRHRPSLCVAHESGGRMRAQFQIHDQLENRLLALCRQYSCDAGNDRMAALDRR